MLNATADSSHEATASSSYPESRSLPKLNTILPPPETEISVPKRFKIQPSIKLTYWHEENLIHKAVITCLMEHKLQLEEDDMEKLLHLIETNKAIERAFYTGETEYVQNRSVKAILQTFLNETFRPKRKSALPNLRFSSLQPQAEPLK